MFKTLVWLLGSIADLADKAADKLTEVDLRWQEVKPELEEKAVEVVADAMLDLEDTAEAFKAIGRTTATVARRAVKAVWAWLLYALPIIQGGLETTAITLYRAYRGIRALTTVCGGRAVAGAVKVTGGMAKAWAFREEMVAEANRT